MCYEKMIDRFGENFMPISYMGSENFFPSNTRYYYLKEKYSSETDTVLLIGELFSIVGKLLLSFLSLYSGYLIYNSSIEYQ